MSITIEDIPNLLLETNKYNYLSELLTLDQSISSSSSLSSSLSSSSSYTNLTIHQQQLFNTLELFTFGNYQQYLKYKEKYIDLDESLLRKLLELTLITIDFENINQIINYQDIKNHYGIEINNNNNNNSNSGMIISLIIKLNFQNLINIKINDVEKKLIINGGGNGGGGDHNIKHVFRDIYSSTYNYKLKVLDELNDINIKSINIAKKFLQNWINERLIPLKNEFEKKLSIESKTNGGGEGSIEKNSNLENEDNHRSTSTSTSDIIITDDNDIKSTRKRKVSDNI